MLLFNSGIEYFELKIDVFVFLFLFREGFFFVAVIVEGRGVVGWTRKSYV